MKRVCRFIYGLVLALSLPCTLLAQAGEAVAAASIGEAALKAAADTSENPLFTDAEVLSFKLTLDYQQLLKDRGEEREYHPATLTYTDASGTAVTVDLKVRVRGNHRRDVNVCRFPPLLLNFSRKTTQNTVFRHVNKVKLVTHCSGDDYVLREYLVYKLYNIITDKSFRVRLCKVVYEDVQRDKKPQTQFAFLIEDDDEMARRNDGFIVRKELALNMAATDAQAMATLAVFQYMIGNTDWSVAYRHNIKLLSQDSLKAPVPVPYDFDYCGIVAPPYAVPPPELGITSVRQRLYRGYDYPDHVYASVIDVFRQRREEIYALYLQFPVLEKNTRKRTLSYISEFYETIDNPKSFQKNIVRVGQSNQKNYVTVKGLK